MRLGCERMRKLAFYAYLALLIVAPSQMAFAQVERSSSPIIEPIDEYILDCAPKDWSYAAVFFSASSEDLYKIDRHLGNTYLRVQEFIETESEGQFLKGYFYNANRSTSPMGFPIPKDREDQYREENGFRSIWFVPSNQWLCSFSINTQEWLDREWEKLTK